MPFYQRGDVRIRYEEAGSGFPLLVIPGGGLNSRIANWPNAVINAMEEFKNDFHCITMDQRNANGGESSGPVPVDKAWDAFADDHLGLMDHLGIDRFFFMGYCIGGCFAGKLLQRAPDGDGALVFAVEIARQPVLEAHRNVLDEGLRMQGAVLEGERVDERFQGRTWRAMGPHQIDLAVLAEIVAAAQPRHNGAAAIVDRSDLAFRRRP